MTVASPVILSVSADSDIVGESTINTDILTLSGTAVPDSVLSLFDGTTFIGTAAAGQSGVWTFETGTLANGIHNFTATDAEAGSVSAASDDLAVTVDASEITKLSGYGTIPNGGVTADDVLTLNGTAEAGSTVTVLDGTQSLGTAIVNSSGAWIFTTAQLGEGAHDFSVVDKDIAGNVSAASIPVHATVETLSGGAPASIGVNMEGAEYSWGSFPTLANLENVKSEGVDLVRLPIAWEMMQPTLNGPLNPSYLAGLEKFLSNAASLGMQVIVDLHNSGTYNLNWAADAAANYGIVAPDQSDASVLGSAAVPISSFANLWQQLATALTGNPAVAGYDIMNEPNNMPSAQTWPDAAQAAVNAIRSVDMNTPIIVEGDEWASAQYWQSYNANLHIVDPANDIVYEAHSYFDNGSGEYSLTYAQQGATPNSGVQDVAPFLQWLQENNYKGFVGELGVPSNNPQWILVLNNVLSDLQANGVSATVWNYEAAQPTDPSWWVSQIESSSSGNLNIAPINGQISPEMALLFEHSAPMITSFSPNNDSVGDIVNVGVITLTGVGAGSATVKVYDGTTLLGTSTAAVNGVWSFTTGALANGAHNFTAVDMDSSGDLSEVSSALVVTVDTIGPAAPTVASFSPDSNVVGDGITNVNHLTLTGIAVAGSTVEVFDGAAEIGSASASSSGTWSFATGTLADGSHAFTAKDIDAAGNVSGASAALNVTIDTVAPAAPTVMSFSPDSNVVGDGITNVNHITLTGTAVASSTVEVFDGATEIGTAIANGSGTWSFATATLANGSHAFNAKDMDVAGNVGAASATLNVTIDTVAPAAPTVASFSPDSNVVGDGITNVNHINLTGTAVAGSIVEVFDGATEIGTTTANSGGAWSFATATLANGGHAFTAKDVDTAGNIGAASAALNVTIDTIAPNAPDIISDAPESANSLLVAGTAEAGSTIKLYEGTTLVGSSQANASGAWNINTGSLSQGSHDFTATATDAAGNVSAMSAVFDPVIGPTATVLQTDGSTSLAEVANNYFLYGVGGSSGPELKYDGAAVTAGEFSGRILIGAIQTSSGYEVAWKIAATDQYAVWTTNSNGNFVSGTGALSGSSYALEALETIFHQDLNGDGTTGLVTTVLQTDGSTSLAEVANNYFLYGVGGSSGPELKYDGAAVTAGEFSGRTLIGAIQTSSGYEVAWKIAATDQYAVWTTNSNGNFVSGTGALSGSSYALEALETIFHQDLNGDGTTGLVTTVLQTDGSTSLAEVANNYFLYGVGGSSGPELKYDGAAVTAGEFSGRILIGAIQTSSGYEVAWKIAATDQYAVWTTNSNGNFVSGTGALSGSSYALEALETIFHQDLNGDGTTGLVTTVLQTDGSTSLAEVANNYFLYGVGGSSGPELKYDGAAVTAGEFSGRTLIGAIQTSSGYEVAWKIAATDQYAVWTTNSNGNFVSGTGALSGSSYALEALETIFHQDLNGDGTTGLVTTVLQTDGSTSLAEVANNYFLYGVGGSSGPELKYDGAAVTAGEFSGRTLIGAIQTSSGYEVAWKIAATDQYAVWTTNSNGNFVSGTGALSGSSYALEALETIFHQDLNGDGVIDTPATVIEATGNIQLNLSHMTQAATIAAGATLELTGAASGSITFSGTTGTLVLDHSTEFTGELIGLTGNGNPSSSDQIDLKDIAFGTGTTESYIGTTSGGVLTIKDAQNDTAEITLEGNYTNSTFTLSSDGHGGTIVIDPPKQNFNFASNPAPANPPISPSVTVAGNDGFVFHQPPSGAFANHSSFTHEEFASNNVDSHLLAFANDAQSDHQWMGAGHDTGFGHLDSMNPVNAHFIASHSDFLIYY